MKPRCPACMRRFTPAATGWCVLLAYPSGARGRPDLCPRCSARAYRLIARGRGLASMMTKIGNNAASGRFRDGDGTRSLPAGLRGLLRRVMP